MTKTNNKKKVLATIPVKRGQETLFKQKYQLQKPATVAAVPATLSS